MKAYLWIAAVVLAAACGGERKAEAHTAEATEPVVLGASDVATATRTDVTVGIPVSGTLEPAVDVRIKSPIPELVQEVLVKEGERVQRGQVLARFRADAVRTAALSTEAQRRLAAADYERMQNLFKEGAVSQRDVENAEASFRAAEAAAVQAEQRMQDATVRAPVSGVIAQRSVESGDRIKDGDPMFRLVNTAQLEFAAAVPSQYVSTVRVGLPVSLTVSGMSEATLGGRVSRVNATADPATRQVKVYVVVPNPNGRLVGGLFASGRVVTKQSAKTLAVPRAAVRAGTDSTHFVLIVDSNRVARRVVETGAVDEARGLVEITKGLSGGETVIVAAADGLREGDHITIAGREGGR